jgi:hypothetical protein
MITSASLYYRHRFPAEIISHCVWLYFRFSLSLRDVEEMMFIRGVSLTHESVRDWCLKFGQTYANRLRRRSPRAGDQWHLDEVFLKINGRVHYLWRAVDQDVDVLDILVLNGLVREEPKLVPPSRSHRRTVARSSRRTSGRGFIRLLHPSNRPQTSKPSSEPQ